jgi:hypothetical protein
MRPEHVLARRTLNPPHEEPAMTQSTDPAMAQAQAWLCDRDVPCRPLTRYQLKIGKRVSYYPGKGTTFVDGEEGARARTGLRGLEEVLIELGYLSPECAPTLSTPTVGMGR